MIIGLKKRRKDFADPALLRPLRALSMRRFCYRPLYQSGSAKPPLNADSDTELAFTFLR